jgi:hypothetical protein
MSDPSPRVPLGQPIPWTDADLDALADVTAADVAAAKGWVDANASTQAQRLWDAKSEEAE